ncbi:class D sortase [uncultured Trichococcus sp.]|uniref:class D sortase n=1 Tax=uncultured Trichococcus sp. TaxID=189665 RepID=UPI0029C6EEC8|nr:class D sortase [uncultured Trichococcus sp.]
MKNKISQKNRAKRRRIAALIGIPVMLFVSGITLLSWAFFDDISYAFYMSRMFLPQEVAIARTNLSDSSVIAEETTTLTPLSFPEYGDEYGTLRVDAAGISSPVFVGDDETQLLDGAGHYYGSVFPGDIGNTVITGHTNTVFKTLGEAQIGDAIRLELTYGTYVYEISNIEIKSNTDDSILAPSEEQILTLYTYYPFDYIGNTPDRYVVTAKLVEGKSLSEITFEGAS